MKQLMACVFCAVVSAAAAADPVYVGSLAEFIPPVEYEKAYQELLNAPEGDPLLYRMMQLQRGVVIGDRVALPCRRHHGPIRQHERLSHGRALILFVPGGGAMDNVIIALFPENEPLDGLQNGYVFGRLVEVIDGTPIVQIDILLSLVTLLEKHETPEASVEMSDGDRQLCKDLIRRSLW